MLKVKFTRANKDGMVNRQHKGEFNREFNNTAELAQYLASTKRVYMVRKNDISKREQQSLLNKFSTIERENMQIIEGLHRRMA